MADNDQVTETEDKPMFDQDILNALSATIRQLFERHGDVLRSVGVFLDYKGGLNEAEILHGLWVGANGIVSDPAAIAGSMATCAHLQAKIMDRGMQLIEHINQAIKEVLEQARELDGQSKEDSQETGGESPATSPTGQGQP